MAEHRGKSQFLETKTIENPSSGPWFPHDCHICLQVEFFLPLETEDAVHVAMDFAWILIFIRFKPAFHHDFLKKK